MSQRTNDSVNQRIANWWTDEAVHQRFIEPINQQIHERINESMSQWINEQRILESKNQRISQPMNQWTSEPMTQLFNESMTELGKERTNERTNEWMNEWTNEGKTEWTNKEMNQLMDGWIDGWVRGWASYFSLLSYFLTERLLRWGTFCVSYFLWAATYPGNFCSELPPASRLYLFCSFCNPILLFGWSVQCILQHPAAIPQSTGVAPRRKTTFPAAVTMHLATSSCNPAYQERCGITYALLRKAVPMRFVVTGCKAA